MAQIIVPYRLLLPEVVWTGAGDASQVFLLDSEAQIHAFHALRWWRKLDSGPMVNEAHLRYEDRPFAKQAGRGSCDGNIQIGHVLYGEN